MLVERFGQYSKVRATHHLEPRLEPPEPSRCAPTRGARDMYVLDVRSRRFPAVCWRRMISCERAAAFQSPLKTCRDPATSSSIFMRRTARTSVPPPAPPLTPTRLSLLPPSLPPSLSSPSPLHLSTPAVLSVSGFPLRRQVYVPSGTMRWCYAYSPCR